jgi:hypothetical protein
VLVTGGDSSHIPDESLEDDMGDWYAAEVPTLLHEKSRPSPVTVRIDKDIV